MCYFFHFGSLSYLWILQKRKTEEDKGTKGIKERKKEGDRFRYEINHSPLNLNWCFALVVLHYTENYLALGGLACLPLDPRFAGSNPAEDDGFF
jgi:hypothetical protein